MRKTILNKSFSETFACEKSTDKMLLNLWKLLLLMITVEKVQKYWTCQVVRWLIIGLLHMYLTFREKTSRIDIIRITIRI